MSNQFSSQAEKRRFHWANKVKDIAQAYILIARTNHYMVGLTFTNFSREDLENAEQVLISMSNEKDNKDPEIEGALDLINAELIKTAR